MADPSDLFHQPHHFSFFSDSGSGFGSEPDSEDPDFLGLGLGFPNLDDDCTDDDFFVARLRVVELPGSDTDLISYLCWDCFRIENEFEREEAAAAAAAAEGGDDLVFQFPIGIREYFDEELGVVTVSPPEDSYFTEGHNAELVYTSEYDEVLFDQFQEQEWSTKGGPPVARSVVEGLPTVTLKEEEEEERAGGGPVNCAVCKDEIEREERVKKLPCGHYYHEECILPWLGMRNTCPLCRHELPTEDAEYESRKARRASVVAVAVAEDEELRVRYDFEMLPDASNH